MALGVPILKHSRVIPFEKLKVYPFTLKNLAKACIIALRSSANLKRQEILPVHVFWPTPGRVAQSVGHLTRKSGVLGSIPGRATYFRFSFRFFKKDSCQLLAKVCARSTG